MVFTRWPAITAVLLSLARRSRALDYDGQLNGFQGADFNFESLPSVSVHLITVTDSPPIPTESLLALASILEVPGFNAALNRCPEDCAVTGQNPLNWTVYTDASRLARCNQTILLDFAVYNGLEKALTDNKFRCCTAGDVVPVATKFKRDEALSCVIAKNDDEVETSVQLGWLDSDSVQSANEVLAASEQVAGWLEQQKNSCNSTIVFAKSGAAVVGLYSGSQLHNQGLSTKILEDFTGHLSKEGFTGTTFSQLCGTDGRGADFAFGVIATVNDDLALIQSIVKTWSDGKCVTEHEKTEELSTVLFLAPKIIKNSKDNGRKMPVALPPSFSLAKRADCKNIQVVSGDSCGTLATKCAIPPLDVTKFNTGKDFCATLKVGQHICCSSGTLPDFTPKPNADGTCSSYLVVAGDFCDKIASANGLQIKDLDTLNKKTWGWTGCTNLLAGTKICLSTGVPPMPAIVANAVCGPQVPGTKPLRAGQNLTDLNPCPLKACCNIWGQCGTTDDFCTLTRSVTGAPGTAAPGTNGCLSNCGSSIIIGAAPAQFMKIAYFEAFNFERPCLNVGVGEQDFTGYTHVHLAFAEITKDFQVDVSGIKDQFDQFVKLKGIKKIVSFGGWSFSTSQDTYPIFRDSVTAANRATFITSCLKFVKDHDIDGLDFDWEYPGAPDIPGVPAGSKDEGVNYFSFLWSLKLAMPAGKTLAIAAPASFWYLKGFPIEAIGVVVDYIIYMTYDLHGQWDYNNKWSQPGCPNGDCLRSHVNLTETINALSMITKAGVPSAKVIVGVTSYGRSFKMVDQGCPNEMCRYTGPLSGAAPGKCTGTSGYIANAEIEEIIAGGGDILAYNDDSLSQILIYDKNWVAYMDENNKALRTSLYKSYKLGGTTDWAIDLQTNKELTPENDPLCLREFNTVDEVAGAKDIEDGCMNGYIILALSRMLKASIKEYAEVLADDYDDKFKLYSKALKAQVPTQMLEFYRKAANDLFDCTYMVFANGGFKNESGPGCPPNNIPSKHQGRAWNIYWVVNDEEKYFTYLEEKYGIDRSWVQYETIEVAPCIPPQDCSTFGKMYGTPGAKGSFTIPDPKDLINAALANFTELSNYLEDIAYEVRDGYFAGDDGDVADSAALPVYLVQSAITSMRKVIEIGEKVEEAEFKNFILLFISAILFIIPGVGAAIGTFAGLAGLGRALVIIGTLGNAALGVYDIVQNPEDAPLIIISALLGGMVRGNVRAFSDAAKVRRAMTTGQLDKLGGNVGAGLTKVSSLVKMCRI